MKRHRRLGLLILAIIGLAAGATVWTLQNRAIPSDARSVASESYSRDAMKHRLWSEEFYELEGADAMERAIASAERNGFQMESRSGRMALMRRGDDWLRIHQGRFKGLWRIEKHGEPGAETDDSSAAVTIHASIQMPAWLRYWRSLTGR